MESLDITVKNGSNILEGTLYLPKKSVAHLGTIVVAHGAQMGERNHWLYKHLVKTMLPTGFSVLISDRRGSGKSTGSFDTASFQDLAEDLLVFINELSSQSLSPNNRIGLWGFSQGGWIAPIVAKKYFINFIILVSSTPFPVADQMEYALIEQLKFSGFSSGDIKDAVMINGLINDYYTGAVKKNDLISILKKFSKKKWYSVCSLPSVEEIPEAPEKTKWYQEIIFKEDYVKSLIQPILLINGENDPWIDSKGSLNYWEKNNPNVTVQLIQNANHYMLSATQLEKYSITGEINHQYTDLLKNWTGLIQ